ncbi:hypothetical protein [Oricola sp.]|uniref:hypothetical protein n=1 Tax=Oricola sp. TaxID=1979950 RepID=UPI003BADB882
MMETLIVLTLLGCDDTATQCNYLRTVEQRYATAEECGLAADRLLAEADDGRYPVVVARCLQPAETVASGPELPAVPEVDSEPIDIIMYEPPEWDVVEVRTSPGRKLRGMAVALVSGTAQAAGSVSRRAGALIDWVNPF